MGFNIRSVKTEGDFSKLKILHDYAIFCLVFQYNIALKLNAAKSLLAAFKSLKSL